MSGIGSDQIRDGTIELVDLSPASIGVYDNTVVAGSDSPGNLIVSATGINVGTTGDKTGAVSAVLQANTLYWVSLIASSAATVRALTVAAVQSVLGRTPNAATAVTYLYAAGAGSTLPATAPTTLTAATAALPAIYLVEA